MYSKNGVVSNKYIITLVLFKQTTVDDVATANEPHEDAIERMRSESLRLETFKDFPPDNKQYCTRLAKAGFYYTGHGDEVTCFCCGIRVKDWEENDLPDEIHLARSPICTFTSLNISVTSHLHRPLRETGDTDQRESVAASGCSEERFRHLAFPGNSVVNVDTADSLDMRKEIARFSTFQEMPYNKPYSSRFSNAGFYSTGIDDEVTCYACGLCVRNWREDDNPADAHVEFAPNCEHVIVHLAEVYSDRTSNTSAGPDHTLIRGREMTGMPGLSTQHTTLRETTNEQHRPQSGNAGPTKLDEMKMAIEGFPQSMNNYAVSSEHLYSDGT